MQVWQALLQFCFTAVFGMQTRFSSPIPAPVSIFRREQRGQVCIIQRNQAPGLTFTQSYSIAQQPITNFTSDLPVMLIDTLGQALDVPLSGLGSKHRVIRKNFYERANSGHGLRSILLPELH